MKLIFAGTPEFAATALQAILAAGHEVVAVYTQPDRPAGRGQKLSASAVKQLALQQGLPVYQPLHFRANTPEGDAARTELQALCQQHEVPVMVVAAYGLILPQAVLDLPHRGCLNIHASLLPRWRGAAPIQRAILAGDAQTGITIMQMARGLDTGDMLYTLATDITPSDTAASLQDRLAILGGEAIVTVLADLDRHQAQAQVQDEALTTYAHKLEKSEGRIDWSQPAAQVDRQIRGLAGWPVAFFQLGEHAVRVWSAQRLHGPAPQERHTTGPAGQVLQIDRHGVQVRCGDGQVIQLTSLQWPGGKALNPVQIQQAQKLHPDQILA